MIHPQRQTGCICNHGTRISIRSGGCKFATYSIFNADGKYIQHGMHQVIGVFQLHIYFVVKNLRFFKPTYLAVQLYRCAHQRIISH